MLTRDGKVRFRATGSVVVREYRAEPSRLTFQMNCERAVHVATREFASGEFNLHLDGKPVGSVCIHGGAGQFDVPAGEHSVKVTP